MHINRNEGFTLIELLVVIAIIGILSSVVLASLNTARDRGRDAAVKSSMQTIRVQSELYFDSQSPPAYGDSTVATACATAGTMWADTTIANAVTEITAQADSGGVRCVSSDTAEAWAMTADLHEGNFWCTDSTGVAREIGAAIGDGVTACPAT